MSILKGHPGDCIEERRPFDDKGRYVPLKCPDCGNGTLKYESNRTWICDGLADPIHDDLPLVTCEFYHIDGDAYLGKDPTK